MIRRSSFTYDILDAPARVEGHFDPSHIAVSDIRTDLRAPRISNDNISLDIKRLGAYDRSGLTLSSLTALFYADSAGCTIQNLGLHMPHSSLTFDNITVSTSPLAQGFDPKKSAQR